MFEEMRQSLGVQFSRWRFRKSKNDVIQFTAAISSARQALLVMPLLADSILPTTRILEMLKAQFGEQNITVVTAEHDSEITRLLPRCRFIRLLKQQVTAFFIPRSDLLKSIKEKQYDLAIDLNLDLVLPSGYICKASNARVRVGFSHKQADLFYNFQIKPDPTLGRNLIYDRLVQCLQKF